MTSNVAKIFETLEYGPAPESDKEAMAWIERRRNSPGLFINGRMAKAHGKETLQVFSPADGRNLGPIAIANEEDVNEAVAAARAAQEGWAKLDGFKRHQYLYAIYRAIEKQSRLFAVLESLDNGKSIRETRDIDVKLAARHFRYHAGLAQIVDQEFPDHKPYGVVGQIIPWNFPLLMLAWKVAPALATGNTVVLKPAEQTPMTALLFAEICREVGLPKGVVNIITGDGSTGALITNHKDINKIAFTGSTEVGRIIREATAGTGKGLTLELGGKSPFIVFEDADLDNAVEGVVNAIWFNQGQVCCGGSRLLVQESVQEKFIEKLKRRMDTLRVGHPLEKNIDMAAVIDETQRERIAGFVDEAKAEGAEIYQVSSCPANGSYYPPTLVTNVSTSHRIVQEEVFGPVLAAMSFRTFEEAVSLANNTTYGLAASVWTESQSMANLVSAKLKCGVVWRNGTNQFDASCGFGGNKESGFGREGGKEGLLSYLKPKSEDNLPQADVSEPDRRFIDVEQPLIDQTPKMFIGGAEARPDSGYSLHVVNDEGTLLGQVGAGSRKDIRNAVEAARKAESWAGSTNDNKGQILRFIAERLQNRQDEFAERLVKLTGVSEADARQEVQMSLQALFNYAAWAENYEGCVHQPPTRAIVPTLNEPLGIIGVVCPNEKPLLSMITMMSAAMAAGNRVVMVPSEKYPLIATDFYQVLRTSDVPGGVVNIVTGPREELTKTIADHLEVDAVWYHGSAEGSKAVEVAAAKGNLKQTWVNCGKAFNWDHLATKGAKELMHRATQVKNLWTPWGEGIGPK